MFKVGEILVCIDKDAIKYNDFSTYRNKKAKTKGLTKGKKYEVLYCKPKRTCIVNDLGLVRLYSTKRFKSLTNDRNAKLMKIRSMIVL